jgi:heme o synthase
MLALTILDLVSVVRFTSIPYYKDLSLVTKNEKTVGILLGLLNLVKIRIVVMVMVASSIAFILSYTGQFLPWRLFWTLTGTALVTGGACTLNCYIEREPDAIMPRTRNRPIPRGVISPVSALVFGLTLAAIGSYLLFTKINMLSGLLGLAIIFTYLAVYTPSKRLTWMNTPIGAISGAIPVMIGWASAKGEIGLGGWILFAMLFLWQHIHFFPIAWMYKDDYAKAGFRMLPVLEANGKKTFGLTVLAAVALLPISILLNGFGLTGSIYFIGVSLLGILFIVASLRLFWNPSHKAARQLLYLSLCYLPVILTAVILDRYGAGRLLHL